MTPKAKKPTAATAAAVSELLGRAGLEYLAPFERRLLAIVSEILPQVLIMLRVSPGSGDIRPLTAEIVSEACRLSLAAAASADDELRKLRVELEKLKDATP